MSDLLLPNFPRQLGIQLQPQISQPRSKHTPKRSQHSKQAVITNPLPRYSISNLIRATNNFALSLRDGLTEPEREDRRWAQEHRQVLAARMENVRYQPALCSPLAAPHGLLWPGY